MKKQAGKFFKRSLTLMELMVVIVIIGLVSSVVAYNVKGSLDRSRAFKTDEALDKLEDVISLYIPAGHIDLLIKEPSDVLDRTGLIKNAKSIVLDGWGTRFAFTKEGAYGLKIQSKTDPEKFRIIELAEGTGSEEICPLRGTILEPAYNAAKSIMGN